MSSEMTPDEWIEWAVKKFNKKYAEMSNNGHTDVEILEGYDDENGLIGILFGARKRLPDGEYPEGTFKKFSSEAQSAILKWQDETGRKLF